MLKQKLTFCQRNRTKIKSHTITFVNKKFTNLKWVKDKCFFVDNEHVVGRIVFV